MRAGWLVAAALALAMAPLLAIAQTQPEDALDPTPYTVREDLAAAGSLDGALRVLRFVQVSDAHILDDDAPYPIRQEPLDDFGAPFTAAQRPQDEFTDEVLDSIVRSINAQHATDAFQFVINTGDNIDNDLENELMRFIDLLDGTTTVAGPVSGLACQPDGQSTSIEDTQNDVDDACTHLGTDLAANHTGLVPGLPWYSAFGNHDAQIQGNVNPNGPFGDVAGEYGRHFLQQTEYVAMHFAGGDSCTAEAAGTAADDFGHGYGFAGDRLCDSDPDNDGYYAFTVAGVRLIVLDTVNDDFVNGNGQLAGQFNPQTMTGADVIGGYAEGAVDPEQLAWMRAEIAANPSAPIVVFSHHTVNSMFSSLAEGYCQAGVGCLDDLLTESGYATGPDLVEELATKPNVIAWIGGHTHRHRIEAKTAGDGGFWNIESSSLIDYPQEARVVELWVTADRTKAFWKLDDFGHDFQKSKDLEATDSQREVAGAGDADDQEVILWVDLPEGITVTPQPEAERRLVLRISNGTVNQTGQAGEVLLQASDNRTGEGVDGLDVSASVQPSRLVCNGEDDSEVSGDPVLPDPPVNMTARGNGTYAMSFTPTEPVTHYATFNVAETLAYGAKTQTLSFDVGGDPPSCKSGKGKGAPGIGLVMVGMVLALVALSRRDR